jgi:hypothetical protein
VKWEKRREKERGFEEETLILEENEKIAMRKKEWDFEDERVWRENVSNEIRLRIYIVACHVAFH